MKSRRLLFTLIPLVLLVACGPDPDDSNAATGNSTSASGSNAPDGSDGSTRTTIAGSTGGDQTGAPDGTGSANGASNAGGTGGSTGSGGATGSGGSGGSGGATGSGGTAAPGGATGSGGTGGSGGAGGSGSGVLPGGGPMDVNAQTVFGFGVGPASVDGVRDAVSAKLGDVTNDTDWYSLPRTSAGGVGDCLADQESRILRWGDLSIAFWRKAGAESIWSWSVGDPSVSGYGDRREPNIPASPIPTGIRTTEGISVGSSFEDVSDAYGEQFQFRPQTPEDTSGIHLATATAKTAAGASMSLLEVGGPITGIGSTLHFC